MRIVKQRAMTTYYYIFVDKFAVPCNIATAYEYISNTEDYPRWWKVYKKVSRLNNTPPDLPGAKSVMIVGGFLPYTLTIENEITSADKPYLICFNACGDLKGKGIWILREIAEGTEITFDWRIEANKKVIRWFSFLLKPLFRANHTFCIRKANEGIINDLQSKSQLVISR